MVNGIHGCAGYTGRTHSVDVREVIALRKVLVVLGVGVLSLPLVFVLWLLVAVRSPKMDSLTMRTPMSVRTAVAAAAVSSVPWGKEHLKGLQRVLALDPENAEAWGQVCKFQLIGETTPMRLQACQKAVALSSTAGNWEGLGEVQEAMGDECAAEESFTQASTKGSGGLAYAYVESMGRASLRCGKPYDARAGLEAAIDLETRNLKEPDQEDDDIADYKEDQRTDREYLVVTFDRLHDAAHAKSTCSEAHPDWRGCACSLDAKGKVACAEAGR
jgi:hypothetical protein